MIWLLTAALAQSSELTVHTWNVGLAYGFVDHAKDRRGLIVDTLTVSDADVLCLQEVWEPRDRRRLSRALEDIYPHQVLLPVTQTRTDHAPACRGSDLFGEDRFVTCLTQQCGEFRGDDKTDCVIEQCGPVMETLRDNNPECAQALMAQVGKSGLTALMAVRSPFRKPGTFAYNGSDGVALLSRLPIREQGVVDFSDIATLNRRRVPWADIAVGGDTVRVYCAHLTADLDGIAPYPGNSGSWGAENHEQAERLVAHAEDSAHPVVLAGDFNCGWDDDATGIVGELTDSCQVYDAAGYKSVGLHQPECTFCADNPIVADDESEHLNGRIDHVFIRSLRSTRYQRLYDDTLTLRDGTVTALSDHYGLEAVLVLDGE